MTPLTGFRRGRLALLAMAAASLTGLSGCATLGGNVKGDFTCHAPDGICAPSSTIDDRALAMISGEAGDSYIPAGPYPAPTAAPRRRQTALAAGSPSGSAAPRTREKVLRIVFQPFIDEQGRLHEATAVHTVVQAEWQAQALADAAPLPDRNAPATPVTLSLADELDRQPGSAGEAFDPNLPDPAVVAAARARRADPIAEIKADVASRLTPRTAHRRLAAARSPAPRRTVPSTRTTAASSPGSAAAGVSPPVPPASMPATAPPRVPPATQAGADAVARVKDAAGYRLAGERAQTAGRDANGPAAPVRREPAIGAPSFPAAVPEDK